jgi:recombination protein RecT
METKAVTTTNQEKNVTDKVLIRVRDLEKTNDINFPVNYSYSNALKSAWLMLNETVDRDKKPVLQTCTESSIMNVLLDMTIQGLSPAKKQCYFIAYGKKLTLSRSYMGTVAVVKRLKEVKDVKAYVIYDGDEFEQTYDYNTATLKITKFNPRFENIDTTKVIGAFAVIVGNDGPVHTEVMNINQIKMAWSKSRTGGQVHKDFAEEMAKKTVINRACKMFANTSDDSDLLIEAFNNSDEKIIDDEDLIENAEHEVKEEIKEKGNSKVIDIEIDEETPDNKIIDIDVKPSDEDEAPF